MRWFLTIKFAGVACFLVWQAFLVVSCHKSGTVQDNLIGTWEVSRTDGSFAGTVLYQRGNGQTVQFQSDGRFAQTFPGLQLRKGSFHIEKSYPQRNDRIIELRYDSFPPVRDSVHIDKDQLIFFPAESCCDFPSTTYTRISH